MKFVSQTTENGLRIKTGELITGSFSNNAAVDVHVEEGVIVVLKHKMKAMELINAAYALQKLADKLLDHIDDVCGLCEHCTDSCPYQEIDEFGEEITLPDYLRKEAGIKEGAKLWASVDEESGTVTISAVDGEYAILDVSPDVLDWLIEWGICIGELENLLTSGEVVYVG